jgi:hypothetical protein
MINSDYSRFSAILMSVAEHAEKSLSKDLVKLYWQALKNFSFDDFVGAAQSILLNQKRYEMPMIGDFIKKIDGTDNLRQQALLEANNILGLVRKLGSYGNPHFVDPATRKLLQTRWTWGGLCEGRIEKEVWFVKDFVEAYCATKTDNQKLLAGGIKQC